MDIKENLAENLLRYRKAHKLTQSEFASKINYSDKAVSKWERAESVPDLAVLKQIADFYGTTIDALIQKPSKGKIKPLFRYYKNIFFFLIQVALVWVVATLLYSFSSMIIPETSGKTWIMFIYALPITFGIFTAFAKKRFKYVMIFFCASAILWTLILSVYLSLTLFLAKPPVTLWLMFAIGIPIQILLIFTFFYKKIVNKARSL